MLLFLINRNFADFGVADRNVVFAVHGGLGTFDHAVFDVEYFARDGTTSARELFNVDTSPARGRDPAPVRDIGDGAFVAHQVVGLSGGQVLVEHAVQPLGLVLTERIVSG